MRIQLAASIAAVLAAGLAAGGEELPPEKIIAMADGLMAKGNVDAAVGMYNSSLRAKDNIDIRRAFGASCYKQALAMKAENEPKVEPKKEEIKKVSEKAYKILELPKNERRRDNTGRSRQGEQEYKVFDPDYPPLVKAKKELEDIQRQIGKADGLLTEAISQYKAVLRLAPGNTDLQATGRIALCSSQHPLLKSQGKQMLKDIVVKYATPANDEERALFDECSKAFTALIK